METLPPKSRRNKKSGCQQYREKVKQLDQTSFLPLTRSPYYAGPGLARDTLRLSPLRPWAILRPRHPTALAPPLGHPTALPVLLPLSRPRNPLSSRPAILRFSLRRLKPAILRLSLRRLLTPVAPAKAAKAPAKAAKLPLRCLATPVAPAKAAPGPSYGSPRGRPHPCRAREIR